MSSQVQDGFAGGEIAVKRVLELENPVRHPDLASRYKVAWQARQSRYDGCTSRCHPSDAAIAPLSLGLLYQKCKMESWGGRTQFVPVALCNLKTCGLHGQAKEALPRVGERAVQLATFRFKLHDAKGYFER